jgi:hypothetical protein
MLLRPLGAQDLRTFEGIRHAPANILVADMLVKFSLAHSQRRLFPGTTKDELSSGFVHAVGKIFERL